MTRMSSTMLPVSDASAVSQAEHPIYFRDEFLIGRQRRSDRDFEVAGGPSDGGGEPVVRNPGSGPDQTTAPVQIAGPEQQSLDRLADLNRLQDLDPQTCFTPKSSVQ